jgi:ribonuclease HI
MNACKCYHTLNNSTRWDLPVRIWGDSQLIIRHLLGIYKKPSKIRVYDAIQKVKALKRKWKHTSYRHLARDLNKVADDMARRALAK